jgi:cytochrome c-type biogenesis protein CcmF
MMFAFGAFVLAAVAQELGRGTVARRALTGDPAPVALGRLIARNRRRYGGYVVHAGLAVLLIGVAASSSFQHSHDVMLAPGQATSVAGYRITYVRPLAQPSFTPQGEVAKVSLGAVLEVARGRRHITTLKTIRGFYPANGDPTAGPISVAFNGQSDSQVGLRAGLTRDIWTVVNPSTAPLQGEIGHGDTVFEKLMTGLTPAQIRNPMTLEAIRVERARAISGLAARYVTHPWPVNFLLVVSPLVTWIWLGAIVIVIGGLIALGPVPVPSRRGLRLRFPARAARRAPQPVRESV